MRSKQKKWYIICMIKNLFVCTITQSIVGVVQTPKPRSVNRKRRPFEG